MVYGRRTTGSEYGPLMWTLNVSAGFMWQFEVWALSLRHKGYIRNPDEGTILGAHDFELR